MTDSGYRFEPLHRHHDRAAFSCGVEPLDRYFHQQVGQDRRRGLAVPYVLVEATTGDVAGYYTLSTFSVVPASLPDVVGRKLPRYETVPAILIGRLAVDRRYRGKGLGRLLLVDALLRSLAISEQVGAMAVVVDAKDDTARSFYEQYGFTRFVDHEYRLFLPMATIAQLEQNSE
jgi:GNAT superfamily N-acetyltransferase